MPPRTIISHTSLIAALLCGWLFFESLRNNQDNLRLMQRQEKIHALREEMQLQRESAQTMQRRIENSTKLANAVGPAILADLAALSTTGRSSTITTLLQKHGIGAPADKTEIFFSSPK